VASSSLFHILEPAYRCASHATTCGARGIQYDLGAGLYPRGYAGATGDLDEVELVLCIAEPGNPKTPRPLATDVTGSELVAATAASVTDAYRTSTAPAHANVRRILSHCWPEESVDAWLRRTWITETVLCSAPATAKRVSVDVERECASRYLVKQLDLLEGRFVIALGSKAAKRLNLVGRRPNVEASAVTPPEANKPHALQSWLEAARAFRDHRVR
jgi:hypothetical protein